MTRLPPTSTLFPYTTLFRSRRLDRLKTIALEDLADGREHAPRCGDLGRAAIAATRDRKSTRLNSSHMSISYAVFCLKKKNHLITFDTPTHLSPSVCLHTLPL